MALLDALFLAFATAFFLKAERGGDQHGNHHGGGKHQNDHGVISFAAITDECGFGFMSCDAVLVIAP
ncbi:MAG: hypothetical protein Q8Q62_08965 [Mesorhizobium sp.]|nr:hypothetical protein [Mesorhizobium sp.]